MLKKYGAIVKSFNAQNEAKYEMMMSIGLLHLNTDKQSDKTPDMGGKVTVDGVVYKQGCWAKESKDGIPFTSLGFQEVNDQSNGNEQPVADKKVPF